MSHFKKEYSILPQSEQDEYHHHVRTNPPSRHCCLIPLVAVTIILIISGAATLTISLFYPETFSKAINWSHLPLENILGDTVHLETTSTAATTTTTPGSSSKPHGLHHHSMDAESQLSDETTSEDSSAEHIGIGNNSSSTESSEQYSAEDTVDNDQKNGDKVPGNGLENSFAISGNNTMDEKYREAMRQLFNEMVKILPKGIQQAELAIPLFMLICFMVSLTIVSLCCCVMMKRRENRRRKMFGKIITDLQTGDSKTVLLNQDNMDD